MYAISRQTDPPTVVLHAVYCNFFNFREKQLVVAGNTTLRVYRLNQFVKCEKGSRRDQETPPPSTSEISDQVKATTTSATSVTNYETKLECVLNWNLFGNVTSMAAARLPGLKHDALFLAFKEANLSVVDYDEENHDLRTLSLHSFEDEILKGGFTRCTTGTTLRTDPENRCCAMLVYGRHLVILPFVRDTLFDEPIGSSQGASQSQQQGSFSILSDTFMHYNLHSYIISLDSIEPKLQNVADLCFLHGYYEPTLLLLYEPIQTTAGRLAIRQDTFFLIAVSLNVKDKTHAVIWTVNSLPFDCLYVRSVPMPIGGVIVFAINSAIYLNQSVPPCGALFNANGKDTTAFPLHDMLEKEVTLDGSQANFITPGTLMLSLRSGEIYVMSLLVDNMNTVKGIHLDRSASSVIPSVSCKCDEGYMFLGSRLGNSLLLRYKEVNSFGVKVATEPPMKKPKFTGGDKLDEDIELYGEVLTLGAVEQMRVSQYSFEVCDSLLNIGPCCHLAIGEPAKLNEEFHNNPDPFVDFVFASGHGKNGALVALQRSVRPHLLTSSLVPQASCIWTAGRMSKDEENEKEGVVEGAQRFLLVSKEVVTIVLELKNEIAELEVCDFVLNQKTVGVGDLCSGRYVVQVTPMTIVLVEGDKKVQRIDLNIDFPVSQVSIVDPYVLMLTENGELLLLSLVPKDSTYRHYELIMSNPEIHQNVPATAISCYRDASGLFKLAEKNDTSDDEDFDRKMPFPPAVSSAISKLGSGFAETAGISSGKNLSTEDEDVLLYGKDTFITSSGTVKLEPFRKPQFDEVLFESSHRGGVDPDSVMPTYWAAVYRENGLLEILSLPDFRLVYMVKKFPLGFKTLFDTDPIKLALEQDKPDDGFPPVRELMLVGLGANKCRPHLFAFVEQELLVYEAFPYFKERFHDHLCLRFKRIWHEKLFQAGHSSIPSAYLAKMSFRTERHSSLSSADLDSHQRLHYFDNVSNYSGLFISGAYPYWCLMTHQGVLRFHPMQLDGWLIGFAPFHNINCERGFMYLTSRHEMRIAQLPPYFSYDASCPTHKVNLKCTAHFIVYLLDSRTYAVTTSAKVPCKKMVTLIGDEKQFETMEHEDEHFIYPTNDLFKVQLYSPETWEAIPNTELLLEEFEHVTVSKEVQLKSEGTVSGLQNYLAFGTIHNYGEEVLVRGRLFVVEVIDVVPEPDQPLTRHRMKVLYSKEQKGPVTSLCSIQGYLLTGMGQKVYIWSFKDNDLVGISFLDLQIYIHQMISVRNLALVGDVFRSISLLRYQEKCKALSLASRDARQFEVLALEFVVDNSQLGFLVSDSDCNLYIYIYQPEAKESLGGQRLIRRADICIGSRVNAFVRIRSHVGDPVVERKFEAANRHVILYGTTDGSLHYLFPLSEKTYRRLLMLQNLLVTVIPHTAGLNPRAFHTAKTKIPELSNPQKNILDGSLLYKYLDLNRIEKQEFAKRIGSTREQLIEDILEIERQCTHY